MTTFLKGVGYPFRGIAGFLQRPALWKYALATFAINLALLAIAVVLFLKYRADLVLWIMPARFPEWLRSALGWILSAVVAGAALVVVLVLGNLLATPFLDLMTERILRDAGEPLPPGRGVLRALARGLVNQTLKLLFFGAIQSLLLLLLATPLAPLHPPLAGLLAVLFLGFEYLDYPLDARHVPVPARFAWLVDHLGASLGFGAVLFLVLWIPFAGVLLAPLAVTGAALLAHDLDRPSSKL